MWRCSRTVTAYTITDSIRKRVVEVSWALQIYGFCHPYEADALKLRLSARVDDVSLWVTSNRLQLNPAKTEILWCASARRQQQIPVGQVRIGDTFVCPQQFEILESTLMPTCP